MKTGKVTFYKRFKKSVDLQVAANLTLWVEGENREMITGKETEGTTIYEMAYQEYCAASERYEKLIQAYKSFDAIREAKEGKYVL